MPRTDRKPKHGRKKGGSGSCEGRGMAHYLLPVPVPGNKLTLMEAKFVIAYMTDANCSAEAAARIAGYKTDPKVISAQVLSRPRVREALRIQLQARAERTQITADRVISEIGKIAFADIRGIFKEDGSLKAIPEMTQEQAALIESLDVDELFEGKGEDRIQIGVTKKLKLYNRLKSLETLAKHLGVLSDRVMFNQQNIQNNITQTTTNNTQINAESINIDSLDTTSLEQLYAIAKRATAGAEDITVPAICPPRH